MPHLFLEEDIQANKVFLEKAFKFDVERVFNNNIWDMGRYDFEYGMSPSC